MVEKAKKTVAITIRRERQGVPRVIIAVGFKLRPDKGTGLLDVLLEAGGQRGERVSLDAFLLRKNLQELKRYAASIVGDQDDGAKREEVICPAGPVYANIVHFCQLGSRAETTFGLFSMSDWVEATRQTDGNKTPEIKSVDNVVVMSSAGFQKKLLLEMILALGQEANE